jgi:inositol polyphosphate 5-phosphatase INPP5B/F
MTRVEGGIESVAETIIRFLESLAEPVIPYSMYKQAIDASSSFVQCKQVLTSLPTVNMNVFFYLMAFLRELLTYSASNKLTPEKLGMCCGNTRIAITASAH